MANWYGQTRTNYFRVKDEDRYQQLFKQLAGEDLIEDFSETKQDGLLYHAFGSYSDISYFKLNDDGEIDYDEQLDIESFFKEIGDILEEGSVFVFTVTGAEKLRYLTGYCAVVFPGGVMQSVSLDSFAHMAARTYYNDAEYNLMLDY